MSFTGLPCPALPILGCASSESLCPLGVRSLARRALALLLWLQRLFVLDLPLRIAPPNTRLVD